MLNQYINLVLFLSNQAKAFATLELLTNYRLKSYLHIYFTISSDGLLEELTSNIFLISSFDSMDK